MKVLLSYKNLRFSILKACPFSKHCYRLDAKAVERLDGPMLLRLQDLRKEVGATLPHIYFEIFYHNVPGVSQFVFETPIFWAMKQC